MKDLMLHTRESDEDLVRFEDEPDDPRFTNGSGTASAPVLNCPQATAESQNARNVSDGLPVLEVPKHNVMPKQTGKAKNVTNDDDNSGDVPMLETPTDELRRQ